MLTLKRILVATVCFGLAACAAVDDGCNPGETRACEGKSGCNGGQACTDDGAWLGCDCGDGPENEGSNTIPEPPEDGPLSCEDLADYVDSALAELRGCGAPSECGEVSTELSDALWEADRAASAIRVDVNQSEWAGILEDATPSGGCAQAHGATAGGGTCLDGTNLTSDIFLPTCSREGQCLSTFLCSCESGERISFYYECDGTDDCEDGSDESRCGVSPGTGSPGVGPGVVAGGPVGTPLPPASTAPGGGSSTTCGEMECSTTSALSACCLADGQCGVVAPIGGACVSQELVDADCNNVYPAGCCTAEGYCGEIWDDGCHPVVGTVQDCTGALVPFQCEDTVCTLHEQLFAPPCCGPEGACGVDLGNGCVSPELDADCAAGPGPGCCLDTGLCGFVDMAGQCLSESEFFGVMPGATAGSSSPALIAFDCAGAQVYRCEDTLCPESPAGTSPCCIAENTCGTEVQGPSGYVCLSAEELDQDCPGLCCTAEGYCGQPAEGGICRVFPQNTGFGMGESAVTDCDGVARPFACGEVACDSAGLGSQQALCCTEDSRCGVVAGTTCIAQEDLDPTCPELSGAPGCCRDDGNCGVWDAVDATCLAVQGQDLACGGAVAGPGMATPPACPVGLQSCAGLCSDPMSDAANCGTCGNTCVAGQICELGACIGGQ